MEQPRGRIDIATVSLSQMLVEFERLSAQLGSGSADILNRVMSKDNIAIGAILLHKATKTPLFVGNAHLHWDPEYKDVKVVQAAMLVHEINKFVAVDDKKRMPILLGGDFNSEPNSGVFKMLAEGEVGLDHPDLIDREYAKFDEVVSVLCGACCPTHSPTSQWVFSALYADTRLTPPHAPRVYTAFQVGFNHDLKLRSVYNGELPYTNYTADFKGIIDYIFYSTDGLAPVKVLGPIPDDVMDTFDGCPNPHFPSDHLPLFAEMALTRVVQPAEVKS
jgi:CCR4-NOT transcription complex subunit 6